MKKFVLCFSIGIICLGFVAIVLYSIFPLQYKQEIINVAKKYKLEPSLVASIVNTESSFVTDAISESGAIGLMQILPTTAEEIAMKKGVVFDVNILLIPNNNIEYGCFYISYLLEYYEGNLNNALCAYNAGLNNVNKWLSSKTFSLDGENLKDIPFNETKNYLEKVNRAKRIYEILYNI